MKKQDTVWTVSDNPIERYMTSLCAKGRISAPQRILERLYQDQPENKRICRGIFARWVELLRERAVPDGSIMIPGAGRFRALPLPMDNYPERVKVLRGEPLENIPWSTNSLTAKDKTLCVSGPYSKGWSATVDGENAEILKANYMLTCIPLTAGRHDIEFHYCSPGLKIGAVLTVCGSIAVIGMLVRDKKRKKKELV